MAKITIWGDFRVNAIDHLNLSGGLQLLLNQSDINVVNFEAPVQSCGKPISKSGPNLNQHIDAPKWLEDHGFNMISLANNHMMDYGEDGLRKTLNSFKTAKTIGAGEWKEAYKMEVVETNDGTKIGFLSVTHREFGVLTERNNYIGCAWCMHPDFERQICTRGGRNDIDFIIILNHGGIEYMNDPLPEWREVYRKWIDMGADVVAASHPHVPQGWESYKGKLICYSLGNFCFQKNRVTHEYWNESLCCVLDVQKDSLKEHRISIVMRPIFYNQLTKYISDNDSADFAEHIKILNEILEDEEKYMKSVNIYISKLLPQYFGLFTRSGFIVSLNFTGLLKGIIERFKKEHMFNCMNCESHRWAIARAMSCIYKLSSRD